MRIEHVGGAVKSSLAADLGGTTADLTITCNALTNWPQGLIGRFVLTLNRGKSNEERILCSSRTGNVITVWSAGMSTGRGWDGTAISSHVTSETVEHTFSGTEADAANLHIESTSDVHGVSGALVGQDDLDAAIDALSDEVEGAFLKSHTPRNSQTGTSYTFVLGDADGLLTTFENAAAVAVTVPKQADVAWLADSVLRGANLGVGVVTLPASNDSVTISGPKLTFQKGEGFELHRTGTDAWWCLPFGSGASSPLVDEGSSDGVFTSITDSGINYRHAEWLADGTLVITEGGWAEVEMFGGGSGYCELSGGYQAPGAGGDLVKGKFYIPAGTYVIDVGAGGSPAGLFTGWGKPSAIGTLLTTRRGWFGSPEGFTTSFDGTSRTFCGSASGVTNNSGNGGNASGVSGSSGRVRLRWVV